MLDCDWLYRRVKKCLGKAKNNLRHCEKPEQKQISKKRKKYDTQKSLAVKKNILSNENSLLFSYATERKRERERQRQRQRQR